MGLASLLSRIFSGLLPSPLRRACCTRHNRDHGDDIVTPVTAVDPVQPILHDSPARPNPPLEAWLPKQRTTGGSAAAVPKTQSPPQKLPLPPPPGPFQWEPLSEPLAATAPLASPADSAASELARILEGRPRHCAPGENAISSQCLGRSDAISMPVAGDASGNTEVHQVHQQLRKTCSLSSPTSAEPSSLCDILNSLPSPPASPLNAPLALVPPPPPASSQEGSPLRPVAARDHRGGVDLPILPPTRGSHSVVEPGPAPARPPPATEYGSPPESQFVGPGHSPQLVAGQFRERANHAGGTLSAGQLAEFTPASQQYVHHHPKDYSGPPADPALDILQLCQGQCCRERDASLAAEPFAPMFSPVRQSETCPGAEHGRATKKMTRKELTPAELEEQKKEKSERRKRANAAKSPEEKNLATERERLRKRRWRRRLDPERKAAENEKSKVRMAALRRRGRFKKERTPSMHETTRVTQATWRHVAVSGGACPVPEIGVISDDCCGSNSMRQPIVSAVLPERQRASRPVDDIHGAPEPVAVGVTPGAVGAAGDAGDTSIVFQFHDSWDDAAASEAGMMGTSVQQGETDLGASRGEDMAPPPIDLGHLQNAKQNAKLWDVVSADDSFECLFSSPTTEAPRCSDGSVSSPGICSAAAQLPSTMDALCLGEWANPAEEPTATAPFAPFEPDDDMRSFGNIVPDLLLADGF